jgi:hypothetical protein
MNGKDNMTTMTKGERETPQGFIRRRDKVLKSPARQRSGCVA